MAVGRAFLQDTRPRRGGDQRRQGVAKRRTHQASACRARRRRAADTQEPARILRRDRASPRARAGSREGGGAAVRRDAGEPGAARATRGTTPPGRGVGTALRRTAYQASPAVHRAFHRTQKAQNKRQRNKAQTRKTAANDTSNSSTEVFLRALSRPNR